MILTWPLPTVYSALRAATRWEERSNIVVAQQISPTIWDLVTMDLELWHLDLDFLDLAIAHFSISIQWAPFLDDHSCTWVYQLCNMFCLFHGQKSCAQLILIVHQSGWLAPAFRWLVCGLPMCVRHFVVVWKPIAWGQFFSFNMAWVDACSLITPFKCVINKTQQCLQ